MRAHSAEPDLYLVRNAHASSVAYVLESVLQVIVWQDDLAGASHERLAEERSEFVPRGSHFAGGLPHVLRVQLAGCRGIVIRAPIHVGHDDLVHVGRCARSAGALVLVGADVDQGSGVTMVRTVHYDDIRAAGVGLGKTQRQLVGFASGTHEVAHAQALRQRFAEPPGVFHQEAVQVARVRVEDRHLLSGRPHDLGMAVTHMTDVVYRIQVLPFVFVVQVLHDSPHDLQGLSVRDTQRWSDVLPSGGQQLFVPQGCVLHAS